MKMAEENFHENSVMIAETLEYLAQRQSLPPRPTRRCSPEEDVLTLFAQDEGMLLAEAVHFLTGQASSDSEDEASSDYGYNAEWLNSPGINQKRLTSESEAIDALVRALSEEGGCFEALNYFKWPSLVKILKDQVGETVRETGFVNLLRAAIKADAYEQAFELAGEVLQGTGVADEKTLEVAGVLRKLSRWVNFVPKHVLERFIRIFVAVILSDVSSVGMRLMQVDAEGKWLRHWLAQTRVCRLLGNEAVSQLITLLGIYQPRSVPSKA